MTEKEIKELLRKCRTNIDNDNVFCKEVIKEKLIKNEKIIYVLNNKELREAGAEPDDYLDVNILPYYMITPTQTNVQNFICFEVQFKEGARYNSKIKYGQVIFYILCEQKNIKEEVTGLARHDLLAALIMEEFNLSNCFGTQIKCVSDEPSVVDTSYACRTLVFEMETQNNLIKTRYTKNDSGKFDAETYVVT